MLSPAPGSPTLPVIQAQRILRTFRRADGKDVVAVRDLSVSVSDGEFVCLVGPSGCGKSTFLQMLSGLMMPTAGHLNVMGKPISGPGADRGMVFQKDSVFPWMRVIDNVEYGLRCRGVAKAERQAIARSYLQKVGLGHVERAWPRELSGGMLKRVAIATVFANGAQILLLDEPFGALDYVTRHQLHDVLLDLWQDNAEGRRRTVLFVTHDVDEALVLADRILVFREGGLIDDLRVAVPRPRTADSLVLPEIVATRHVLLRHLGLERLTGASTTAHGMVS